ncbi:TonB C-terminal domain-containing protein [Candidatus Dependentiae bacterium]|nr:TonB C-terminal domain-containing protein [Candidatus Dependentiae bacterium]
MKNTLNKNYIIASIAFHIIIIFVLGFVIRRDALQNKNFVIFGAHSRYTTKALYKNGSPVPFTNNDKSSKKTSAGKKGTKKSASKNKKIPAHKKDISKKISKKIQEQSKATPKEAKKTLQKLAAAPQIPAPTAMVKEQSPIKSKKKKIAPKKLESKKLLVPMPTPIEKEIIPEEQPEKTIESPVQANTIEDTPQQPSIELENTSDEIPPEEEGLDESPIHIGVVDAADPVTRYHQRVLSQEITRLWTPPPGVRKGTECSISITFSKEGMVKSFDFIKRSNIPIYDLSILRLKLAKFSLPTDFRTEKPLLVVFHQ